MSRKKKLINYSNRDFQSIKNGLEEHARLYYPDTYKDFSENSFGSFILDTVSYVGDMLSFYLDYQVNESFLETALEYENVRKLSRNNGLKHTGRPAAFGMATFYIIVPANQSGLGPDTALIPVLRTGTEVVSTGGTSFVLIEDVDFANPKNEMVAARFDGTTGKPESYAIRAQGQIKSSILYGIEIEVGNFTKFLKVRVGAPGISEIRSVRDTEGHQYYEVEHLSQDVVYIDSINPSTGDGEPLHIIKPKIVPRRYVVIQDETGTYLQFGYGSDEEISTTDIADPSQIALKMSGKPYTTDYAFDPSMLLDTNTLGVSPANTTLSIQFYQNDSNSINVAQGNLSTVSSAFFSFPRADGIRDYYQGVVRSSIEVTNDESIVSDSRLPTSEELRVRSYAAKSMQMRAVTRNDYEAMIYMMPPKFGSVKRASIINDPSSSNRRLSLYVISSDSNGYLTQTNSTTKQNIKTWLNKNKMINDNIDIHDARIINIGFEYKIIVDSTRDKVEVLNSVNLRLVSEFANKMYIGEPLYLTNIFNIINKVDGVLDTTMVKPEIKIGTGYASAPITIDQVQSNDGTFLKAPKNIIFEIKYPSSDIRGTAI